MAKRGLWLPAAAAALGALLLLAAALSWYPPLWRQNGAAAPNLPFFEWDGPLVDINAAAEAELAALPGIGEARARAIAEYRAQNGPYKSPEELLNVRGIGEKVLEGLRGLVRCGGA